MAKLADVNEKIAQAVVDGYKNIEAGVVGSYKKIEKSAVDGFTNVMDACVEKLFVKKGESVAQAKERLASKRAHAEK